MKKLQARTTAEVTAAATRAITEPADRFHTLTRDNGTEFQDYKNARSALPLALLLRHAVSNCQGKPERVQKSGTRTVSSGRGNQEALCHERLRGRLRAIHRPGCQAASPLAGQRCTQSTQSPFHSLFFASAMTSGMRKQQRLEEGRLRRAKDLAGIDPRDESVTPPAGAVMADRAQLAHNNTYDRFPRFYVDKLVTCRQCGKEEVWPAERQKWWYEVAKGNINTQAVLCRSCRNAAKRRKDEARRVHLEGLAKKRGNGAP